MPVFYLLRNMPAAELAEWIAYYQLHPWGEEREDLRAGMIAAPLLNCWTKGRRWKPQDWVARPKRKEPMSVENMKTVLQALAESRGVVKGKKE